MTTKAIQLRRGTTTDHALFTGLEGEITVNNTKKTIHVHDGKTLSGFPLAREDLQNVKLSSLQSRGVADNQLSNVSDEAIIEKGIAKCDLSNVDKNAFLTKDLLKTDMSNLSVDAQASTQKAGLVELATFEEAKLGLDNTKAITPLIHSQTISLHSKLPPLHITGLLISNYVQNPTKEIEISKGSARDKSDTCNIVLTLPISKKLNKSFETGTGMGGLAPNLTIQNNQVYYVFILYNPNTGIVDAGFDINSSAQNLMTNTHGFTKFRRVGLIKTDASGNILEMSYNEQAGGRVRVYMQRVSLITYNSVLKIMNLDFGLGNLITPIVYSDQQNCNIELKFPPLTTHGLITKFNAVSGLIIDNFKVDENGCWDMKIVPYAGGNAVLYMFLCGFIDDRIA